MRRTHPPCRERVHQNILREIAALRWSEREFSEDQYWIKRLYRLADQVKMHGRVSRSAESIVRAANMIDDACKLLQWVAECNDPKVGPSPRPLRDGEAVLNPLEAVEQRMRLEERRS